MARFGQTKVGQGRYQPLVAIAMMPLAACAMMFGNAQAASINAEASSPQRATTLVARSSTSLSRLPVTTAKAQRPSPAPTANQIGDGVPDLSWGGPRVARPQIQSGPVQSNPVQSVPRTSAPAAARAERPIVTTPQAVRQVRIPVLGREGQAFATRAISISASEPDLTSVVRPQDVASFQKIGAPYQVAGTWYVPAHEPDYDETGVASWYGNEFHGRPTANGEIFDMNVVSAAHPTLPIPSLVEVTNLANGRSMVVRVNDRGPFVRDRLIDLSARGAQLLGFAAQGHTNVRVRYVGVANSEPVVTAENLSPSRVVARTQQAEATPQRPQRSQDRSSNGQTFVQVGAFAQRENAQRLAEQSSNLGRVRVIETAQPDGKSLYRVVLPVSDRTQADAKVREISTNGYAGARVLAALN